MENDEKLYTVIVDPSTNDRMAEHVEFLARINENAANRLADELVADIRSLKTFPHRNPFYNRPYVPLDKYRYMISGKRYRIIYQVDGDFVFVDDIEDCRQGDDKSIFYNDNHK